MHFFLATIAYIFGPRYFVRKKDVHIVVNLPSGWANFPIWTTRKTKVQCVGSTDLAQLLQGKLNRELNIPFITVNSEDIFSFKWALGSFVHLNFFCPVFLFAFCWVSVSSKSYGGVCV